MVQSEMNCPTCGASLPSKIKTTSLVACEYCDTLVFWDNKRVKNAGKKGVLAQVPSLINLDKPFHYAGLQYLPVGQLRFDYGQGFWDEYWVLDHKQKGRWVSVDEGAIAFENPYFPRGLNATKWQATKFNALGIGKAISADTNYTVTEKGTATCLAIEGSVPEKILVGDRFNYAHLQHNTSFITIEFDIDDSASPSMTKGQWIDPFEVKAA